MTSFMQAKFRLMEKLHRRVVEEEKRHDQMGGAVLIMDLEGIEFSTKLLSMLTGYWIRSETAWLDESILGPYRIMWGTLFDQYPQIIQQIIIVNAPSFVNVLHTACSPFLPNDYKVFLKDWRLFHSSTIFSQKYTFRLRVHETTCQRLFMRAAFQKNWVIPA